MSLPERYISFARIILIFLRQGGCRPPPSPPAPYAEVIKCAKFEVVKHRFRSFFVENKFKPFLTKQI